MPGNRKYGDLSRPQPLEPQLALFELEDEVLEWQEATVWLDKGVTPRFTYPNGMVGLRGNFRPIADKLAADPSSGLKNVDFSDRRLIAMQHGKLPHIQIHEVEIIGPIHEPGPRRQKSSSAQPSNQRIQELVAMPRQQRLRRPVKTRSTG